MSALSEKKSLKTAFSIVLGIFALDTVLDLVARWFSLRTLAFVTKPLLMLLLAACIVLLLKLYEVRTSRRWTLASGLVFGAIGDTLLMLDGTPCFLAGMGAFLLGHVMYFCTLPWPWIWRGKTSLVFSLVLLAALLFGVTTAAGLFEVPGIMGICIAVYACAFGFLIHACIMAAIKCRSWHYVVTAAAFLIFAVSDSMVAMGVFTDIRLPHHGFFVMLTYILAQTLVAFSLAKQEIVEKSSDYGVRLQLLDDLRAALARHEEEFYAAFDSDFGKGAFETYTTEIGFLYNGIRHTRKHLRRWMEPEAAATSFVLWPGKSRMILEPYGKVLIIGPFNYPLHLAIAPLAAALAAGNTAVVKASRQTPAVSAVIGKMLSETFSPDVVEVVPDSVSNEELLARRFDYIFFTGSPRVGKIVMEAASKNLTPVTLELGGKSPAIVCSSASVRLAAERIAKGKFLNAGQTCVAPDYVLVHESVHAEFIDAIKAVVRDYFGDTSSRPSEMTLMAQKRHWERVMGLIDPAKVVCGGNGDAESKYIAPTVLDNCTWDDKVMQEEIFGPVLPVIVYSDLDSDVISPVKAGEKPLSLYVFSKCGREIRHILSEVSFGGGCVNETVMHLGNENIPFGGVGNSGMGAYHGKTGFETFSHRKSILYKSALPLFNFDLLKPPYGKKLKLIRKVYR